MESNFVASGETSMCMSSASVESTVREGFVASGSGVHAMLDLWNNHHKCCENRMLKPLYTLHPFRNPLERSQMLCDSAVVALTFRNLLKSVARFLTIVCKGLALEVLSTWVFVV